MMGGDASKDRSGGLKDTIPAAPRDPRAERLAASLRANLKRRKQQARRRAAAAEPASGEKTAGK